MNEEITDLIKLIDQLDKLREEHTITYEGLHQVTELMKDLIGFFVILIKRRQGLDLLYI